MIGIIVALIVASGIFSLFEQALTTVRKPRLQKQAETAEKQKSRRRRAQSYRRVLQAAENPEKYLMAANFWVIAARTLAAILAGLIAGRITAHSGTGYIILLAAATAAVFILMVIVLGSLIPRFIARHAPEHAAVALLPLFEVLALPLRPFYALTHHAGKRLHEKFPSTAEQPGMTEDELRHALMEGEKSCIVESNERIMVEGVFYLGDRSLGTFMTHRSDIQWLNIKDPPEEIRTQVLKYRTQRCFPVVDGTLDSIIGAAYVEDIILDYASDTPAGLRAIMKKALFAPETMPALKAFESFRKGEADFLFVMDEYGGFAGMVRVHNLMEEIVGELTAHVGEEEQAVKQEDGSWLACGSLNIDDAERILSLPGLSETPGDYHTLAGFVLSLAGELPLTGDSFTHQGYSFTVVEMDGNRIEKIAIKKET